MNIDDIKAVAQAYPGLGTVEEARSHGSGHINDTYAVTCSQSGKQSRYVFQRINRTIFKNIESLMENVARVTAHLANKNSTENPDEAVRDTLTLIPTESGASYYQAANGDIWRAYHFIENAETFDVCTGPDQAREAARAFGLFQKQLVDLSGGPLKVTIPYFHHTPRRYAALDQAWKDNVAGRRAEAEAEMAFCQARQSITARVVDLMQSGRIPERTTHNDTKLNNVMIDRDSGRALCVIDLDTVMPGSALFDFGDMIRTFTPTALEDERDLSKVRLDLDIFEGLAQGYGSMARDFLNDTERELLVFAGKLITFTIGLRFLTDHLAGDVYFKVHRPGHNLDRARTQFKMVAEIEKNETAMEAIVKDALANA